MRLAGKGLRSGHRRMNSAGPPQKGIVKRGESVYNTLNSTALTADEEESL